MSFTGNFSQFKKSLVELFFAALHASGELFKIIVPISIVTRFLQQWGIVDQLGVLLGPVMELVGLPGQLGLVWATAMVTSIYGGMVVFASVAPGLELTVAQVTVLGSMILVAHGLPVELRIAQKAGTRFRVMAVIRIGGALLLGWILHLTYQLSGTLQQANHALWNPELVAPNWSAWAIAELRNMVMIFIIILALMTFLRVLKLLGISDLMTRLLEPVLTVLGMGREAAPITIIGMTLGLSYGGGLIIQEAQSGHLSPRDIFSSVALMGLCHSIFEDTLLLMVLGAHISGALWGRLLFSLLVVFLLARLVKVLPPSIFDRYLMRRTKTDLSATGVGCC
ncbi:Nucleoside recognition [Desulfuromusa kysingii]|uniref:Nucleoside recognition n=1 Tax=Desulfuromusa kysingii TaxID=37625 RepID=A0A1H4E4I8_9BACT|nr:nucleoside recognition domain-containing protein [Desulfuromusa kysingii]SEA79955.1 Nucleoside recognition [Desulfuromusa kysingii]